MSDNITPSDPKDAFWDASHPDHNAAVQRVAGAYRQAYPEGPTAPMPPGPHRVLSDPQPPAPGDGENDDGSVDDLGRAIVEPAYNPAEVIARRGLAPDGPEASYLRAETDAVVKELGGEARFAEATQAARWAVAELDDATSGQLTPFLVESGAGDDPRAIQVFAQVADLLAVKDEVFIASIPKDRTEAARFIAAELDRRVDGRLSNYIRSAGLDNDPSVIRMFATLAEVVRRGAGEGLNPATVRAEIDAVAADPAYIEAGHPKHKAAVERMNRLYTALYK